jgi:hypothetical protein
MVPKFVGDMLRGGHRQGRERPQPRRVLAGGQDRRVVRGAAQPQGLIGRQRMRPGRGQGQDRDVDALRVHRGDPALPQIFQPLPVLAHLVEREALVRPRQGLEGGGELRHDPVFLDGDESHDLRPSVGPVARSAAAPSMPVG